MEEWNSLWKVEVWKRGTGDTEKNENLDEGRKVTAAVETFIYIKHIVV